MRITKLRGKFARPIHDIEKLYMYIFQENIDYEDLQKLPYLDWCLNEALRLHPPALK